MKKILLSIAFMLLALQSWPATFIMNVNYEQAYMEILHLRFNKATDIINSEKKKDPNNFSHVYLTSYIDFLKVIISEEQKEYDRLLSAKSSRVKKLESVNSKSPWRLYSLAQLNLQSAMSSVKFGDYFKAARDINKAYSQFTENDRLFPDFKPNKAGLGLLHVLIGSIPDSFKWVSGMLGMEGDVDRGLKELQGVLLFEPDNQYPFLFTENLFITTFVTFNLAGSDSNTNVLLKLLEDEQVTGQIKDNPLLIYAVSSFYSNRGINDKALVLLIHRPTDSQYYPFYYLDYLTGIALLNKLDTRARFYLLKYVTSFKGRNFIKSAYQRLAWSYLIEGNKEQYKNYIYRVSLFGSDEIDNDKEAAKEAKSGYSVHPELLKVRLLFDGGYYTLAEEIIQTLDPDTLKTNEKIEYKYRQARVSHSKGNLLNAKAGYLETYKLGKNSQSYYAANSILKLGNIYEEEGNSEQSLWCYRECLKLDFDEYRNSIHQKAKAGISRLSN